jgi:hypothetical protein
MAEAVLQLLHVVHEDVVADLSMRIHRLNVRGHLSSVSRSVRERQFAKDFALVKITNS